MYVNTFMNQYLVVLPFISRRWTKNEAKPKKGQFISFLTVQVQLGNLNREIGRGLRDRDE